MIKDLLEQIQHITESRKISHKKLCEDIGVPLSTYRALIYRPNPNPSANTLIRLLIWLANEDLPTFKELIYKHIKPPT